MVYKILKNGVLALAIILCVSQVQAQKFGYLNSAALLSEMAEVKQADANLETLQKQLQKQLQKSIEDLQGEYLELQKKEKRGELSPKQIQEEAAKLKTKEEGLAKSEQGMVQQMQEKRESLLKPILDRVNKIISQVATENGYDYIFDSSVGMILYADEKYDVTSLVKAKLGL